MHDAAYQSTRGTLNEWRARLDTYRTISHRINISLYTNLARQAAKVSSVSISNSTVDICSIPENVTEGVHSSIIKLENLTITGVIPSAFKGKLESPHPPLSKNKRIKLQKVKAW